MGKTKIKMLVMALIATILTFINASKPAYYSTLGQSMSVVTSGNIRFIIHQSDQGIGFPEDGISIIPGDVVSKKVSIENDCDHPFYLRIKIEYGIDSKKLSAKKCFNLDINDEHWELYDGWYYYKDVVDPDETTPALFSQLEFDGDTMDNNYVGKTLTLTIKAQAVQSQNNPISGGNTYTAIGWPAE